MRRHATKTHTPHKSTPVRSSQASDWYTTPAKNCPQTGPKLLSNIKIIKKNCPENCFSNCQKSRKKLPPNCPQTAPKTAPKLLRNCFGLVCPPETGADFGKCESGPSTFRAGAAAMTLRSPRGAFSSQSRPDPLSPKPAEHLGPASPFDKFSRRAGAQPTNVLFSQQGRASPSPHKKWRSPSRAQAGSVNSGRCF